MSLHRIAMSRTTAGDLNLVFLNAKNQPLAFKQTADGVWHPTKREAAGPPAVPNPAGTEYQAILGLNDGYGLLALDYNGIIWATTQQGDTWSPAGFIELPQSIYGIPPADFAACEVRGFPLCVVASIANTLSTQYGSLTAMSQATAAAGTATVGQNLPTQLIWGSVVVAGIDPRTGPQDDTPTAVVCGCQQDDGVSWGGPALFLSATSIDGVDWTPSAIELPSTITTCEVVALAPGYRGTLQAIVLASGLPYVLQDTSGIGASFQLSAQNGGQLPNPANLAFTQMAALVGTDGNLQVVGLSGGLPYLLSQDQNTGLWNPYVSPLGQGMQLPMTSPSAAPLQDLVMGFGNQGLLQVGYLGNDGQVYVNFQDSQARWGWFGPLPGV